MICSGAMRKDTETASDQGMPPADPFRTMFLNIDTLTSVMPWIEEREDLLSFISTCAGLYEVGVPRLLRFHYKISAKNLPFFHTFLQSKSPTSFSALRSLEFCFGPHLEDPDNAADMFVNILSRAKNLQSIDVTGNLPPNKPALDQALASLPSLQHLGLRYFRGLVHGTETLLKHVHSPLTSIGYDCIAPASDVIASLAHFHRTLEKLEISDGAFCYNLTAPCYSNLISLRLMSFNNTRLAFLVPAFPNLRTLDIKGNDYSSDEAEEIRAANLQFQCDHPSQRWHLSSLEGDAGSLYILGLQSGVPQVSIMNIVPDLHVDIIGLVLWPLRPFHLSIANVEYSEADIDWLLEAISPNGNELFRLDLSVMFESASVDAFSEQLERLDELLSGLNLISLTKPNLFVLSLSIFGDSLDWLSSYESHSAYDFLDSIEIDTLAAQAQQAIPTLKVAKLHIHSRETRLSSWFYGPDGVTAVPPQAREDFEGIFDDLTDRLMEAYHGTQNSVA